MKKINIRKVTGLTLVAFLLLISMHFESLRIIKDNKLLAYTDVHTRIEKLDENNLFDKMNKDAVILFTSENTDSKEARDSLYKASVLSNMEVFYEFDLTHHEGEIAYDIKELIEVKKEQSEFYKKLLDKLDPFTEVYALKNYKGDLVDTGYKRIFTPYVVFIKDGKVNYSHYLSSEKQKSELKDVYLRGFEMIMDENM